MTRSFSTHWALAALLSFSSASACGGGESPQRNTSEDSGAGAGGAAGADSGTAGADSGAGGADSGAGGADSGAGGADSGTAGADSGAAGADSGTAGAGGAGGSAGANSGEGGAAASASSDGGIDASTDTGPPLDAAACAPHTFEVTATSTVSYTIDGMPDPELTLCRGTTYTFDVNAPGHPFYIKTVKGNPGPDNTFDDGVTGAGTQNGTVTFAVPEAAPDTLYYQCGNHATMTGPLHIRG